MILLNVVEPMLPSEAGKRQMEKNISKSREVLSRVKSKLEDVMDVRTVTRVGNPPGEILKAAYEFEATCIMLCSRLKRPILGSTTSYILSHSKIPVLVCKGLLDQ